MVRACWLMSIQRTNVVREIELWHVELECKSLWWKKAHLHHKAILPLPDAGAVE